MQKLEKQGKPSPPSDRDPLDELDLLDELSLDSESDGGSDSSVSDGTPAQCKALNKKRVKKKRKSKRSRNKNKDRRRRVKAKLTTATITGIQRAIPSFPIPRFYLILRSLSDRS